MDMDIDMDIDMDMDINIEIVYVGWLGITSCVETFSLIASS